MISSSVFPTVARASIAACASAARASGNRCPITGRSRPDAASASADSVYARSSSGDADGYTSRTPRAAASSSGTSAHAPPARP